MSGFTARLSVSGDTYLAICDEAEKHLGAFFGNRSYGYCFTARPSVETVGMQRVRIWSADVEGWLE